MNHNILLHEVDFRRSTSRHSPKNCGTCSHLRRCNPALEYPLECEILTQLLIAPSQIGKNDEYDFVCDKWEQKPNMIVRKL